MAAEAEVVELSFPTLPAPHADFITLISGQPERPVLDLLEPYKQYDAELRKAFSTQPGHPNVLVPNILSVFDGHESAVKIRARDLDNETEKVKESYIMPLKPENRKENGSPAIVESIAKFKEQFSLFSESALSDLDWSNVVAAGSSVVTPLLPIPEKYSVSKRAMRQYYHEVFAPASDVDLFLYGLSEEDAIEKIKRIEQDVKDALLVETTTVRTKNALTIVSQYPTRHIQIVLRVYKSISEILTGFDVDCSCAAFDGKNVWASPRAISAYMTQVNTIDLTRRSPSYESRLSKYNHRGFEVYWPDLDRSRIDPTIYERSFLRTEGLARLLVTEKLPTNDAREAYLDQRREERGRPVANRSRRRRHKLVDDIKNNHEDEIAEWAVDSEEVSNYHTFTIPYGPRYNAAKIERLVYTKDLLLNSEWNIRDREVNLHRHPAFIGTVEDVIQDCCGFCPKPTTMEEEEVYETESKIYVSGELKFIKDDPGRQTIGSFNPLTADDYTEMAYVGNTEMLCRAIVDGDLQFIESWLQQEGNDPNTRDYTGRAPLHLAVTSATVEVVQLLIDHGARLVARLADGRTALHLACIRGSLDIVQILLKKSAANEELEEEKVDARRRAHAAKQSQPAFVEEESDDDSDVDMVGSDEGMTDVDATTEASMVNIKSLSIEEDVALADDKDEPDFFDINVLAWDVQCSPLHLAIVKGHIELVKFLVSEYGADVLLPAKLFQNDLSTPRAVILTLVLALRLPKERAVEMSKLLFDLGATCSQADMQNRTAFHVATVMAPELLDTYIVANETGVKRSINHCSASGSYWNSDVDSPFMSAIQSWDSLTALRLLGLGAKPSITHAAYTKAAQSIIKENRWYDADNAKKQFESNFSQPITLAIDLEQPDVALALIREYDVDVNTMTGSGYNVLQNEWSRNYTTGQTILDCVQKKLKELREWTATDPNNKPPKPLKTHAQYLAHFKEGTYQLWSAEHQLDTATKAYKANAESYAESQKNFEKQKGKEEKQAAIFDLLDKYRELEAVMLKRNAKTFAELHPEIKSPNASSRSSQHFQYGKYFDEAVISFRIKGVTDDITKRYAELFDAAWQGDVEKLKEFVLSPWTDGEGNKQEPCRIAVQDNHSLSPFAIAIMRGHFELADIIIELAKAQYSPDAETDVQKIVRIKGQGDDDDDYDSYASEEEDDNSDDVKLETDIVGTKFTIENVGEVIVSVKTSISPAEMMNWTSHALQYCDRHNVKSKPSTSNINKRTLTGSRKALKEMVSDGTEQRAYPAPTSLIQWAMWQDDSEALKLLLESAHKYHTERIESGSETYVRQPGSTADEDFDYALKLDRPHYLAELIEHTGAGVPMNRFVKKSDVETHEKSKFYQGLSIHGKKKKEWAMRGRDVAGQKEKEDIRPPLLIAAHYGALETVEWLLSDVPLRCYRTYAETHLNDGRLEHLEQQKGGFDGKIKEFLNARSELAIHCGLLSVGVNDWDAFEFLVKNMPENVNQKNEEGITPLHIAFTQRSVAGARFLIKHGADQTLRTKDGRNIVHMLLAKAHCLDDDNRKSLREMLDLIDKRVLPSLLIERSAASAGTITPFAEWVSSVTQDEKELSTAKILMEYSKGTELDLIDGSGHTPLHTAITRHNYEITALLVGIDPKLVSREDATGRTPFEVVEDEILADVFNNPFQMPSKWQSGELSRTRGDYNSQRGLRGIKLVDQDSENFVKDVSTAAPPIKRIAKLLEELKANNGMQPRTLVTLNEANEVARRLAARQVKPDNEARMNWYQEQEHNRKKKLTQDEVAVWFSDDSYKPAYGETKW